MPTYAPVAPYADNGRHPRAFFLIIAIHAAVIAAVMMAKGYVPVYVPPPPTVIDWIPEQKPPPESPPPPRPQQHDSAIDHPTSVIQAPLSQLPQVQLPQIPVVNSGPAVNPGPVQVIPTPAPVRAGPRFITPDSDVKPPYPDSKLRSGEEAVLQLRLSIDDRGRVIAVDPVGPSDPVFLSAARRHILARWRYKPATEDGRAVVSSELVRVRFELN
jgi:protein TonB